MKEIQIPEVEMVPINQLKVDGKNPNRMTSAQREALKKNMQKYGFIVPIITNKDLLIADGQNRWEIGIDLRMMRVPVIRLPLEEVDRKILRQVLNKLRGEHDVRRDLEEYDRILKEISFEEFSDLSGLSKQYIQDLLDSRKEFPEEYLELQRIREDLVQESERIIKLNLTKEQKEMIFKKLKEDGKKLFQIMDYFVLVEE